MVSEGTQNEVKVTIFEGDELSRSDCIQQVRHG